MDIFQKISIVKKYVLVYCQGLDIIIFEIALNFESSIQLEFLEFSFKLNICKKKILITYE